MTSKCGKSKKVAHAKLRLVPIVILFLRSFLGHVFIFLIFFQLKVGFCLSHELVHKVNEIPFEQEQEDGTLLTATDDDDRILIFKLDLKVEFSNNDTQVQ